MLCVHICRVVYGARCISRRLGTAAAAWAKGTTAKAWSMMRHHQIMPADSLMWPPDSWRARRGATFRTPTQPSARAQVALYSPRLAHAFIAPLSPPHSSPCSVCLPGREPRRLTRPTPLSRQPPGRPVRAPGRRRHPRKLRQRQRYRLLPKRRLRKERRSEEEHRRTMRETTSQTTRRSKPTAHRTTRTMMRPRRRSPLRRWCALQVANAASLINGTHSKGHRP